MSALRCGFGNSTKRMSAFVLGATVACVAVANLAAAQAVPVDLRSAGRFAILSSSGITDVYASAIVGDVGTSPITGAALLLTCGEVVGKIYTVDAAGFGTAEQPAVRHTYETKGSVVVTVETVWHGVFTISGNGLIPRTVDLGRLPLTATVVYPVAEGRSVLIR